MIRDLIIEQFKIRISEESIPRIIQCLNLLKDDQIWYRHNAVTNSIGNLVLHLEGNARQWVLTTFCGCEDHRNREAEFSSQPDFGANLLIEKLEQLKIELEQCVDSLNEDQLTQKHQVQCFEENGISILVHVIEHFSYHTGQIVFQTKYLTGKSTDFYGDLDLNKTKS